MATQNSKFALAHANLRPLARCMAAIFLLADASAYAATVTNCNDSGTGSLRWAVANTGSGGVVDMSNLTTDSTGCQQSRISLTTGAINITQQALTIAGPGTGFLVTGKYYDGANSKIENARLFNHSGKGKLTLENFGLRFGYFTSADDASAYGGCINSEGTVSLVGMEISHCRVSSPRFAAKGGAVSAHYVKVLRSTLESNSAVGGQNNEGFYQAGGYGGAIMVTGGGLYMKYSTLSGNEVSGYGVSGGAIAGFEYYAYIKNSTISSNVLESTGQFNTGGGAIALYTINRSYYSVLTMLNSTITGNSGGQAALRADVTRVNMYNSTIAFNESGGLEFFANAPPGGVSLNSVILSNNVSAQYGPEDLFVGYGSSISGSHNLVFVSTNTLPPDTITGKCPLLAPLRDNGGATQTLMLHSGSPAIDAGNNLRHDVSVDQRGSGYPRGSGPPDIGAYEVQQDDIVFNAAFDGC
jgi:hypothetical protein